MLSRQVPFYYLIITVLVACVLSYCGIRSVAGGAAATTSEQSKSLSNNIDRLCTYDLPRLSGYRYVRPLLSAEKECESEELNTMKANLMDAIRSMQATGSLISASIYVRDFKRDDWISINDKEKYTPASMMKVPMLMTYLRMAEANPSILGKQIKFEGPLDTKLQFFQSKVIEIGHTYTVKELLRSMISNSDNNATDLLAKNMDTAINHRMFIDLGLSPLSDNKAYNATAREMSSFLRVLYDASYLNINNSEYATSLLSGCDFKKGLVSGLPDSVRIAHKYGEYFNKLSYQLHETGLVYLDNSAYLITIMTKGNDMDQLAKCLATFSSIVYQDMKKRDKSNA